MKLTRKVLFALGALMLAILALNAYFQIQREITLFDSDMRQDHHHLNYSLKRVVALAWRIDGERGALALIASVNSRRNPVKVRWVWLDCTLGSCYRPLLPLEQLEPVRRGAELDVRMSDSRLGKGGFLVSYIPVPVPGPRRGAIELSEPLEDEYQYIRRSLVNTIVSTGFLIVGCGILAVILGVILVGRPTRLLVQKARRISAGDLSEPLVLKQNDELGELAVEINAMCARLAEAKERVDRETVSRIRALEQLRHADRLMTVGKLASGIAHELGTPLSVVAGRAQMIASGEAAAEEARDNARIINEQVQRMTKIIRQLLNFSRRQPLQKTMTDLRQVIAQTVALLQQMARKHSIELRLVDEEDPAMTLADEGQIQQVMMNLVVNAIQAIGENGEVTIGLRRERTRPPPDHGGPEGTYLCAYVEDTGQGMDAETMAHIFEPFFTTKDIGEGTGLGLSVSYGILGDHGGWIAVRSEVGKGSTFSVYLPEMRESYE